MKSSYTLYRRASLSAVPHNCCCAWTRRTAMTAAAAVAAPSLLASSSSSFSPSSLVTAVRAQHTRALYQQQQQNNHNPHNSTTTATTTTTALDVAMQVNQLKRLHQQGASGSNRRQVEAEAWALLNSLQDEQINAAEGKAVALLLNTWAYFAKFWENGKDGPAGAAGSAQEGDEK